MTKQIWRKKGMSGNRVGVYFLGDDGVYEWALGMLHSLRVVAPDVLVYCVPFSDRLDRLRRLEFRYRFKIINDPSLVELDNIGYRLFSKMTNPPKMKLAATFRKMYIFWGPLDRFLYTDADVIMLDGFVDLFEGAATGDLKLQYAHSDIEQVYRPGLLRQKMLQEFNTQAINTGLWASRAGVFTLQRVRELADEAGLVANEFCWTLEQPFLNYCLDVCRVTMKPFDIVGKECAWPGDSRPLRSWFGPDGRVQVKWPDGSLAPAIHWAGYNLSSRMPYYSIYRHFGMAAMSFSERVGLFGRELSETYDALSAGGVWQKIARIFSGKTSP